MSMEAGADASPFTFTRQGINELLVSARAVPPEQFLVRQAANLAMMGGFNNALYIAHQKLVAEHEVDDLAGRRRTSTGFLFAYNVMQDASQHGLIVVDTPDAIAYVHRSIGRRRQIVEDVEDDFHPDQHPALHDMFGRLMFQETMDAARVFVGMHGHQNNPSREKREILPPDRSAKLAAANRGGIGGTGLTAEQLAGGRNGSSTFVGASSLINGGSSQHLRAATVTRRHR